MKKILIIILAACAVSSVFAQSNFAITYPIAFATGDMGDFIQAPSFRGIAFDYRYSIKPNIALGLNLSWTTFYEAKDYDTYTVDNVSLSGKQYRYSNNVPMLATATYYLKPGEKVSPFATLGLGTMYTRRNTDMNLYTVELEAWNFTLQPEIGVQFQVLELMGIVVSGKYPLGFEAGGELPNSQSYFSLNIGLSFF